MKEYFESKYGAGEYDEHNKCYVIPKMMADAIRDAEDRDRVAEERDEH